MLMAFAFGILQTRRTCRPAPVWKVYLVSCSLLASVSIEGVRAGAAADDDVAAAALAALSRRRRGVVVVVVVVAALRWRRRCRGQLPTIPSSLRRAPPRLAGTAGTDIIPEEAAAMPASVVSPQPASALC